MHHVTFLSDSSEDIEDLLCHEIVFTVVIQGVNAELNDVSPDDIVVLEQFGRTTDHWYCTQSHE